MSMLLDRRSQTVLAGLKSVYISIILSWTDIIYFKSLCFCILWETS